MAQNRKLEFGPPQSSDSGEEDGSSEETEESESGEEEEEEEEEQRQVRPPVPTPQATQKPSVAKKSEPIRTVPNPQSSSSGEETDSESESESESESDPPSVKSRQVDPNAKAMAIASSSKPAEEPIKESKKSRSKQTGTPSSPPPVASKGGVKKQAQSEVTLPDSAPTPSTSPAKSSTGAKRVAENEVKESKRAKRKLDVDSGDSGKQKSAISAMDDSKKLLFQRLWSEDDELVILKGMIDYKEKIGADPVADIAEFHDFIKKSLHIDVSKSQLKTKVRTLKKKYVNNASREKTGKTRNFSKPHEQKTYELSKKIWGFNQDNNHGGESHKTPKKNQRGSMAVAMASSTPASSPKSNGVLADDDGAKEATTMEVEGQRRLFQGDSSLETEIIRDGLQLISDSKKAELEEKWKKLRVQEIELYLKRIELIQEQTKLVLEAMK